MSGCVFDAASVTEVTRPRGSVDDTPMLLFVSMINTEPTYPVKKRITERDKSVAFTGADLSPELLDAIPIQANGVYRVKTITWVVWLK